MNPLLRYAVVSILVSALMLAVYHRFVVVPGQRVAVVDLEAVIGERQALLQELLIKAANDDDRAAVQRRAAAFPQQIQTAVDQLSSECKCLVLDRTVLAGVRPDTEDLTAQLKQKVTP